MGIYLQVLMHSYEHIISDVVLRFIINLPSHLALFKLVSRPQAYCTSHSSDMTLISNRVTVMHHMSDPD